MDTKPNADVHVDHVFSESPARVFDAWTSVDGIRQWFFPPTDEHLITTADAKVGGRFNFTVSREGQVIEHSGTYSVVDRPRRLTFTWELPKFSDYKGRVIISITAIGTGSKLSLIHEDIREEYYDKTKRGWMSILERLDNYFQTI